MAPQLRRDEYMVGWVCALPLELAVARTMLDEVHETPLFDTFPYKAFGIRYLYGRIGEHNVVIARLPREQTGTYSATAVVRTMKRAFPSLRFALMVGIGGGVPSKVSDIRLGDVVVGSSYGSLGGLVQQDSVKNGRFDSLESLHAPPQVLADAVEELKVAQRRGKLKLDKYLSKSGIPATVLKETASPDLLYAARYDHKGGETCEQCDKSHLIDRKPRSQEFGVVVHYGRILSGNQVIKSATERNELGLYCSGALCYETGLAGLIKSFPCLVVRGICDYADSHKNKQWQNYAATTAAAYAKGVLSIIKQAEVARMVTADEAMRWFSDHPVVAERKTPSLQKISPQPVSGLKHTSITKFINEIAVDLSVNFDSITWEWELPDIPASDTKNYMLHMKNNVVLVCMHSGTHGCSNFEHVTALTCGEYLKHSQWADFIIETLRILSRVEPDGGFSRYVRTNPPVWITCSRAELSIKFRNKQACLEILDLIGVLDWVCKSIHKPTKNNGYVVSSASYRLERDATIKRFVHGPPSRRFATKTVAAQPHMAWPCVRLETSPLPFVKHSCWLSFFRSCAIIDSPVKPHDGSGEGLETSFDLMITLAAAECCFKINSSLVLLGYRTLLYPVKIDGNCAHFHLITTAHGQINPYTADLKNIIPVENFSQFRTMRCFVGWCEDAQINLGTRQLGADINYTSADKRPKSLKFKGFSLIGQIGAAGPVTANLAMQPNFEFDHHVVRFTANDNYSCLLHDTSQQQVILYDSKQRRCWLVPKLSLLLHMAQRYGPCSAAGMVPYAEPHMDAQDLIRTLEPAGHINVVSGQDDPLQLRTLMFMLSTRILDTAKALEKSSHGNLYGFELMDIISNPDQGSCMKKLKITSRSISWLELVNAVGTVVVGSNLGEVISAEESSIRKCKTCNIVPNGQDYFTATIPCLLRLAKQQGVDLIVGSDGIKFSDDAFWKLEMNPFIPCHHEKDSGETCWKRPGLIQQVDPKSLRRRFKWRPLRSHSVQSPLIKGAVVFR